MEKITSQFGECLEEAQRKRQGQKSLTRHEQKDFEKQTAFDYAKANDLWIDNLYSLGKPTEVSGYENMVALDEENSIIYKSNNLFNSGFLISNLFQQLILFIIFFSPKKSMILLDSQDLIMEKSDTIC